MSFDDVARRVTRLKLFRVLAAVREVRTNQQLDPNEPVFKDPNALLRRLVRDNAITEDMLLDPWGGTIQFVRAAGPPVPFLSVIRRLRAPSPGPDGVLGSGDDVSDPFARVCASGSPYAVAVEEDRLVDSKWDMAVSEETVHAWRTLFESLTGTTLGGEGVGLSGTGEGGGGKGEGIGLGGVGTLGHGRGSGAISTGDAFWTAPVRTDAEGRVRLTVPLGDAETTWRLALVGVPDGLEPASTTIDVASEIPLSVRVDTGARWTAGDVVEASVTVRNRTANALRASLDVSAGGAAAIERAAPPATLEIPANGARQARVRVLAKQVGDATLVVTARAPGVPDDVLRHDRRDCSAGQRRVLTQSAWVERKKELAVTLDSGYGLAGEPRLVLERGYDDAVLAALDSLEPERQTSTLALVDALEAAIRVERWATTRSTTRHRALADICARDGHARSRALRGVRASRRDRARRRHECDRDAGSARARLDQEAGTADRAPRACGAVRPATTTGPRRRTRSVRRPRKTRSTPSQRPRRTCCRAGARTCRTRCACSRTAMTPQRSPARCSRWRSDRIERPRPRCSSSACATW